MKTGTRKQTARLLVCAVLCIASIRAATPEGAPLRDALLREAAPDHDRRAFGREIRASHLARLE